MLGANCATLLGAGKDVFISNGSSVDFEYDSLTGWTSVDEGLGVSTQTTFDGKSTFYLRGGTTYNASNTSGRNKQLAMPTGDRIVVTLDFYLLRQHAGAADPETYWNGGALFGYNLGTGKGRALVGFFSDGLFKFVATRTAILTGASLLGAWRTLTLDITGMTATPTFDVYLDNVLIASGVAVNSDSQPAGTVGHWQYSRISASYTEKAMYLDRLRVGNNFA